MSGFLESYKYKYNGKEYQDELGLNMYDYGFRNYMPDIGRWFNIDSLADIYYDTSPYAYVKNNPITTIDPDGRYLFGLFGSTSDERRLARAEKFAEKTGGSVVMDAKSKPTVNVLNAEGDGIVNYNNFGDFSSWSNFGNTLLGFVKKLDEGGSGGNEYAGDQGQREFVEDMGTASTYVKGTGVVVASSSVFFGPEMIPVGASIYNVGSKMDDVSTAAQVIYDVKDASNGKSGAGNNAIVGAVSLIGGNAVGNSIDKTTMDATQKFMTKVVADKTIDVVKNNSMKKVEKK